MLSEDAKLLKFNQYKKFDEAPFIIYVDLECLIENIDRCKNNPENLCTAKGSKYILSSFSMSTIQTFKSIENKYDIYRGKECMKKTYESLKEHVIGTVKFLKKELLTKEQRKSHKNGKSYYTCKKI